MAGGVLAEVGMVATGVALGTYALDAARTLPGVGDYVHLGVAALFLGVATHMTQRQPDGLARYGLRLGGLLDPPDGSADPGSARDLLQALSRAVPAAIRATLVAAAVATLVFPPFIWGFTIYHAPARPFALQLPAEPLSYALSQLLVVALPEEALFRGYVQGRLSERFTARWNVLGVSLSPAATFAQCALFALLHFLVEPHPARLAVFFPALLFTWLSTRQHGIGAAVVFHALCNLLSDLLVRGFL